MKAKHLMTANVVTVAATAKVHEVARLLADNRISAVPVVDAQMRVIGIVSEGDLLRRKEIGTKKRRSWWLELFAGPDTLAQDYAKAHSLAVRDLMSAPVISVAEDTPLAEIADILEEHAIKRVTVIRDGKLVGIVSRKDVLTVFLREDEDVRADIVERVFARGLGIVVNPATVTVDVHDGEAVLTGQLELKSQIGLVEDMTRHIDGVVVVTVSMSYRRDDTHGRIPDPMTIDITRP